MMKTKRSIQILSFTLLVVMLGYGMVLPVMPFYIEKLGAGGTELGWLMATYSLMQLIFAPIWGALSDRVGRKPVLLIGILGYAIALLFFGLAESFWMLFAARSLSGILSSATMPTSLAYIGDKTSADERSRGMGQLGAAMGGGVVLGPLMGGFLSEQSLSLPFFIGSGMAFAAFLLVILILPESHSDRAAAGAGEKMTGKIIYRTLLSPAGILLLMVFIMSFGLTSFQGIIGLYAVDKFSFDTRQIGGIWMAMGIVMVAFQGFFTGMLTRRFGELALICAGLVGGVIGYLAITQAINYATTLLAISVFSFGMALIGPALNARLSHFSYGRQGVIMGMNSAANSLGRIIGPLWAGYLYDVKIEYPFLSGAIVIMADLIFCLSMWKTLNAD
jgi:DHA1 family multidrug resistance protein-like MFS transporter